ncbi:A-adding tRNA nucleotidyltransferase [subsurface metagenome]
MSTNVKTAREDMPISKVVNIMINNNINRLPILNNDGKLTGIITRADIIKSIIKKSEKK